MTDKKNTATLLVEIANDLYTFGCATAQTSHHHPGDPEPTVYVFAIPRNNPNVKRPLPDIRSDLADVYMATYNSVPNATALGDAMTVLDGQARKAHPIEADENLLAVLLGGAKTSIATELVKLAKQRYRLGVTTTGEPYAVPVDGPNVARLLRGGRRSLRADLARAYFDKTKQAANAQALADAILVLEGEAQGIDPTEVALRVGRDDEGSLVLDLGADDGHAVVVDAYGWALVPTSPVLFWRTNASLPLPAPPYSGGDIEELHKLLNVSDDDWPLIVAWLVAALIPEVPHPVLLLRGEHGTAKSTAARLMTSLIDRCASQLRTAPRNVEDWAVAAAGSWVTCLDNVSDIQDWLQDAICRAVTGDGLLRRQLYTDSDVSVLAFRRVVAITSVDPGKLNGDLADRLVTVELERIQDDARAPEEDLRVKWHKTHPVALAGLLDITVKVFKLLPTVRRTGLPRMADFARVLLAVDQVLGTDGYDTYAAQADSTAEQVAESDAVIVAIRTFVTSLWEGTASQLLAKLTPEKPPKGWPETPQGMGAKLVRAAPSLRALGWTVEKLPRIGRKGSRRWSLTPPAEETPAGSSAMSDMSADPADKDEPADNTDDQDLFADDPHVSDPWIGDHVSAGGDVADIADMSAGTSSNATVWTASEADLGPCIRCQALCVRYGDDGDPLCPDCRSEHT